LPPETAIGRGGDLTITTPKLIVRNQATIAVSSRNANPNAKGAGQLTINAQTIQLDNKGAIAAESFSGQGGNIQINPLPTANASIPRLLLLRNASNQNPGNGGNIQIATPFIVAIPRENSDITANAFTGNGGRITINAENLIGIQFRPRPTALSDITASSERGNQGSVTLNTPDIDPSRGLTVLPTVPIDVAQKIDRDCNPNVTQSSSFVTRGTGGLPANPTTRIVPNGLIRLAQTSDDRAVNNSPSITTRIPIEAQTAMRLANGQIRFKSTTPITIATHPRSGCLNRLDR
jgi:large exoprotein involved in heme utilization and adhesion